MKPSSWFRQGHAYGVKMKTDFNRSQLPYLPLKNSKTEISPFSYQLGRFQEILVCFIMPVLLHQRIRENRKAYMKKKFSNLPLKLSFFFPRQLNVQSPHMDFLCGYVNTLKASTNS